MDQFVVVGAVDVLSQSIVIGVSHRPSRRCDTVLGQALVVDDAHILSAVVRAVNRARCFLSTHDRLVQRLQRQGFGAHRIRQRAADNLPGEYIGHERGVHKAFPGAHVGNLRHPQPMRAKNPTFTMFQVWARIRALWACAL